MRHFDTIYMRPLKTILAIWLLLGATVAAIAQTPKQPTLWGKITATTDRALPLPTCA
ncbi:MAG: hypothetical protein ACI3YX_08990 [Prevotella sp.]